LGSPAVSRFYRVLQGPPARGAPGTHRGTLGTHGYLTGVLTGNSGVTHRGTHGYPQVLAHAWAGFNATLFAYGQTGSGKTHTMVGEVGGTESPGSTGVPREYRREYPRVPHDASQTTPAVVAPVQHEAMQTVSCHGVARRAPRVSTPSTDGSTPSISVSTLSTPPGAGKADGVVPRLAEALFSSAAERRGQARVPPASQRGYSGYSRGHSDYSGYT
jgi:hypothetical protein